MNFFRREIKESIKSDFHRFRSDNIGLKSVISLFLLQACFRFMVIYRLASVYSVRHPLGIFSRVWFNLLKGRYNIQIYLKAQIGKGFMINHYGNIIVNQGSSIGDNCNIAQGVTIGNVSRGRYKGCPTIGDRVWIGPNAVVVGKVKIGNDVLIAPLTYVNRDIPDGAVVSGNPFIIHNYNGSGVYVKNLYKPKKNN